MLLGSSHHPKKPELKLVHYESGKKKKTEWAGELGTRVSSNFCMTIAENMNKCSERKAISAYVEIIQFKRAEVFRWHKVFQNNQQGAVLSRSWILLLSIRHQKSFSAYPCLSNRRVECQPAWLFAAVVGVDDGSTFHLAAAACCVTTATAETTPR